MEGGTLGHREELQKLKAKLGSWSLGAKLINPESWWRNELLVSLCRPCWSCFAARAKGVKTGLQLQQDYASKASASRWAEELRKLLDNGFYGACKTLYPTTLQDVGKALDVRMQMLMKLLEKRLQSLSAQYCRPPYRYAGALLPEKTAETMQAMSRDFGMLLEAERQLASGSKSASSKALSSFYVPNRAFNR